MKLNKLILATGLFAVAFTSCTDLDVPVESQYTAYPGTEEALEAQMSGIFFQLRGMFGRRYMEAMALSSDEYTSVSYGGNWYDNGAYAHPSLHNFGYEDATIDWMGELTSGIVKANEIIDSDADEARYIAPARAMRAYFTFIMMDCWGDVPINDSKLSSEIDLEKRQPRADVARIRKKTAFVFQNYNLFLNKTVLQNVTLGLTVAGKMKKDQANEIAVEALKRVGMADKLKYYPAQLSGGQQQRVAIARGLVSNPEIIYFDEPTSALDPELIGEVLAVMRQLAEEGMTMLVVTHEMDFARHVSNKVLFMTDGNVVESGPSKEFFEHPQQERSREFIKSILEARK